MISVNILYEIVVFNSLVFAATFVKLGYEKIKNPRWYWKSKTKESISQFYCINLATSVPIKSLKNSLDKQEIRSDAERKRVNIETEWNYFFWNWVELKCAKSGVMTDPPVLKTVEDLSKLLWTCFDIITSIIETVLIYVRTGYKLLWNRIFPSLREKYDFIITKYWRLIDT